jgi:hypothetical protein
MVTGSQVGKRTGGGGELTAIGEERFAAIKEYAAHYGSLTDAKATELTDRAIGLEEKRLALIKRYVGRVARGAPRRESRALVPGRNGAEQDRGSEAGVQDLAGAVRELSPAGHTTFRRRHGRAGVWRPCRRWGGEKH